MARSSANAVVPPRETGHTGKPEESAEPIDEADTDYRDAETGTDGTSTGESGLGLAGLKSRVLRAARRPGVLVTALAIVALTLAAGFFGYRYHESRQLDQLHSSALESAKQYTVDLASYDYNEPGGNLEKVTADSTEEFANTYKDVATKLQDLLKNGQGVAQGKVDYAGIAEVDENHAVATVFLDQDVKNVNIPQGRTDASRMLITLVHQDGRWLLDKAEPK